MATLMDTVWLIQSGFIATSDVKFRKGGKHQAPGVGLFLGKSIDGVPSFGGTWIEDTAKGTFQMVTYIGGETPFTFNGTHAKGKGSGEYTCDSWFTQTGQFNMSKIITEEQVS